MNSCSSIDCDYRNWINNKARQRFRSASDVVTFDLFGREKIDELLRQFELKKLDGRLTYRKIFFIHFLGLFFFSKDFSKNFRFLQKHVAVTNLFRKVEQRSCNT